MEWTSRTRQSRTRAPLALACVLCATSASAAIVVPVRVQGVGPFSFVVDTGAESTVVHPEVARQAGLRPAARIELVTLAGVRVVPQAPATLEIDARTLAPVDVLIHDLPAARALDPGIHGILGRDALGAMSFTLDHARGRLVLESRPSAGAVPYEEVAGRPVIEARLGCAGAAVRLALDSGANGLVLFERRARPLPFVSSGQVAALTNGGTTWLRAGQLASLCVGNTRLTGLTAAVHDDAEAGARVEDGLLPTRLFARVHFDPRAKTVTLETR